MDETLLQTRKLGLLVESENRKLKKQVVEHQQEALRESLQKSFGVDIADTKTFAFDSPFFSYKNFRESSYGVAARRFQEANAEGVFGQLLRAGINSTANGWYLLVPTNHEQICAMTVSTHAVEPHAPVHRGSVPKRVVRGGTFPQTRLAGRDLQIWNDKFGAITGFETELFEDDQTGQVQQRSRDIGDNMAIIEDAWAFQRFIGTAGTYGGDTIPASQTFPSGPFTTGQGNRPASYVTFTSGAVQTAKIALDNMLDLLGNKMLVNPNTILVAPDNQFSAATLMNSTFYPSTATIKAGGGGDTLIGASYGVENVLKGLFNVVVSRFMPAKSWALGEAGKGLVFQMRSALEVIQENPQAGSSFTLDMYQYRARARWGVDWVEPLFWYLGDDGTV